MCDKVFDGCALFGRREFNCGAFTFQCHAQNTTNHSDRDAVFKQLLSSEFSRQLPRLHQGNGVVDEATHAGAATGVHVTQLLTDSTLPLTTQPGFHQRTLLLVLQSVTFAHRSDLDSSHRKRQSGQDPDNAVAPRRRTQATNHVDERHSFVNRLGQMGERHSGLLCGKYDNNSDCL